MRAEAEKLVLVGVLSIPLIYFLTKPEEAKAAAAAILPLPKKEVPKEAKVIKPVKTVPITKPVKTVPTVPEKAGIVATTKPVTPKKEMEIVIPELPPPITVDLKTAPESILKEVAKLRPGYEEIILYKPKPDEEYIDVYIEGGPFLFSLADPLRPLKEMGIKVITAPKYYFHGMWRSMVRGIFRVPKNVWYRFVEWMVNSGYPRGHTNKAMIVSNKKVTLVIYGKLTPILYLEHYLRRTVNKTLKPLKIERGTYGGFLKLEIVFPDITKAVAFCRIFPKFKEVGHMYIHEFKLNGYKIFRSVGYKTRW